MDITVHSLFAWHGIALVHIAHTMVAAAQVLACNVLHHSIAGQITLTSIKLVVCYGLLSRSTESLCRGQIS